MAQVYATKLPSRPSTPLSTCLAAPHRLHAIRTTYANAAHSFLLRDFPSTASHLSSVLSLLPPRPLPQSWLLNLQAGQEDAEGELRRKIDILTITFLATLHSLAAPVTPYPPLISAFLSLPAPALIQTLWNGLLEGNEEGEILPTPKAAFVHPSIITALTLCALKLDEPRLARSVAESWFGSTSEQVEGYIVSVIEGDGLDLAVGEFGVGMGGSMSIGRKKGGRALVGCWLRLLDLLTLHVLPRLGEWEAGEDFVRLQSGENGGWLPDARVEGMLKQMEEAKEREVRGIANKIARQKAVDLAAADKIRERKLSKGKGRPSPSPPTSPTSTSTPLSSTSTSTPSVRKCTSDPTSGPTDVKGFAALRSSLSQFLSTPSSSLSSQSTTSTSFLQSYTSALLKSYKSDPLRFISIVSCVVALLSWYRRTRIGPSRGRSKREIMGSVLGRVGETLRMGTRVSSL